MSGIVRRLRCRHGQSVVEYLVVTGAILLVLVGLTVAVQNKTKALGTEAGKGMSAVEGKIGTEVKSEAQ